MLKARLLRRIEETGPMPFEDYMAACLYDPDDGYFTAGPLRSAESGDFLTSPEVSPLFGTVLARYAATEHARLGAPAGFTVVDVGAGSGSLLTPMLLALADAGITVSAFAVEASPAAVAALGDVLSPSRVLDSLGGLPGPVTGVIVANELVDNLPVAIAVRAGDGWEERWVGADGDDLVEVARPIRSRVAGWCERFAGPVPEGGRVEVQLAAADWIGTALSAVAAGSVVVIDYGGTGRELTGRRKEGTLRTYQRHHLGPDPLAAPGETDLTVDVDFSALASAAKAAGAGSTTVSRQDEFLRSLGLDEVVDDLRHRELDLARDGDPIERLQVRSQRTGAETLLHPRGLGDFRVLRVEV